MTVPAVPVATSIIVPAFEHEGLTEHCLRATLVTIGDREDVEVIVVDDASPEPLTFPSLDDPRLRILRNTSNLRFAGSCNAGARVASGARLVFLNNDTVPAPGWLVALEDCVGTDPSIGVVGARLLYPDGTVQHAGVAFSQSDGVPRHIYRGFPGDHAVVTRSREFQAVTAACMLVTRKAFEEARGFDEAYANGYEDIDLCLRIRESGCRVVYCADAVLQHLETVSRRDEVTDLDPRDDANLRLFTDRWIDKVRRDEIEVYTDDHLITVESGEIYPLSMMVSEQLALSSTQSDVSELMRLLNIRSRQVFDLEKEIGYLSARLLDHGIEP